MSPEQDQRFHQDIKATVEDVLSRWAPYPNEEFNVKVMRALLNLAAFEKDIAAVREGKTPIRTDYPIPLK